MKELLIPGQKIPIPDGRFRWDQTGMEGVEIPNKGFHGTPVKDDMMDIQHPDKPGSVQLQEL